MAAKRFLIMAGGTGGHVFPAMATAKGLQDLGHRVFWLGAFGGMEVRLVEGSGIPLHLIAVSGLRGKGRLALLGAPLRLIRALWQALRVLRQVQPDCVVGMGGFVTGPGGLAAWLTRRPLVIHEQNAVAGMTNRILARFASRVLEAFPGSFGKAVDTRCTGNPVRAEVAAIAAPQERLAGRDGAVRVLVLGGSLGAQALNTTLPLALAKLPEGQRPDVRHQCGRNREDATRAAYAEAGVEATVEPFIADMGAAYSWADLVVCRAGALTIAELCAAGLGAILVPFPHAVDDHQTRNGQYMVDAGAAQLYQQAALTADMLADVLRELCGDRERLMNMACAARGLARPDATNDVVMQCLEMVNA